METVFPADTESNVDVIKVIAIDLKWKDSRTVLHSQRGNGKGKCLM